MKASRKGLSGLMSNTIGIMTMGLISVTLFFVVYRKGLEPILKGRKSQTSKEFADIIYQQEVRMKDAAQGEWSPDGQ